MFKRRTVLSAAIAATAVFAGSVHAKQKEKTQGKSIIFVYSKTGNTLRLAERIAEKTGAPLIQIKPLHPYAKQYAQMTDLARHQIETNATIPLTTKIPDLSQYTDIYIGGPYWWGGLDVPMRSFLTEHPMEGKKIFPFITSGSSNPQGAIDDIKRLCPKATIEPFFYCPGSRAYSSLSDLDIWIEATKKLSE